MGLDTTFSRVRKSEFFAILAPGIYVVSTSFLIALALVRKDDHSPWWRQLMEVLSNHFREWPIPATGAFFAYLVGCVLRAVPVSSTDDICGGIFKRTARGRYEQKLYEGKFPYVPMLKYQLRLLRPYGLATKIRVPSSDQANPDKIQADPDKKAHNDRAHMMFNYWKATLCQFAPESFVFTQDLEGQVRLFSGMLWGSTAGFLISVVGISAILMWHEQTWLPPLFFIAFISLVIAGTFGWRLRRVRGDEVRGVFLAYAAFLDGSQGGKEEYAHFGKASSDDEDTPDSDDDEE